MTDGASDGGRTICDAIAAFLDSVSLARSANTTRTYRNGLEVFQAVLIEHKLDPEKTPVSCLKEDAVVWLAVALKDRAPTTERLYLTAVTSFYEYLTAEGLAPVNLPRVRLLIRQRARRPGQRLPQFPRDAIEQIVSFMLEQKSASEESETARLRTLRDRAFLVTLADTGLRVHEACGLRRGDIDWFEGRAIIIGKGNKQAVVRFSQRSMQALRDYLTARSALDGSSGRPLAALPLFARHDKGAGKKIKPITTATGRNIVSEWVEKILGPEAAGSITPHSFRHYFVTRVLQSSGNLKLAQELARHTNIAVTQRYAHLSDDELDKGYYTAFEEG
ncbi:MAG: tyrosine-type recombinase/integrase [Chloroflexi bacterium]|nr:tyrosine-type recombinase/integrase [Chloroflexota bacterium]